MFFLIEILDIILTVFTSIVILPIILIFIVFILLVGIFIPKEHIGKSKYKYESRKLLRLVPGNLSDIEKKGVIWMLYDTDEGGYFNHVYTIHYPANISKEFLLNEKHTVIEVGRIFIFLKTMGFFFYYTLINGIYFFWNIIKMRRFVKGNISVIRGQDPDHMGLAAVILSKLTGIACCISIHADHGKRYKITKGKHVYTIFNSKIITDLIRKIVLLNSQMVMVIRESLIPYVVKYGVKSENIRIIPHGVHLDKFENPIELEFERKWKQNDRKLVVFAGRLYPENYIEDIIMIADSVRKKMQKVLFLMLGDGIERKKAEALTRELNLTNNILFLGFQPLEKVVKFRKIADVNLCLMAGFSLIEAAAAGRPIVSYDVEWHYELVKNGETGYLIKEHDVDGAAEAIIRLISNPELAKKLGENARKLANQNHSIEKTSQVKRNCYEELIKLNK